MPSEKAEARAIRRRWISLGELVAVAGVLIAALTLWLNWADRRDTTAAEAAKAAAATRKAARATLIGRAERGGERVRLNDPAQPALASIDVAFPRALGIAAQTAVVDPRIEADWVREALLKATDGGKDAVRGTVPLLITATISEGDRPATDRAIYDLVFATEGRTFGGRALRLEGAVFRERVGADGRARLEALWATEAKRLAAAIKE
ncbi:hypothetical protein SAMN06297144_2681 [Sphingomonas guangdongensis]|uniref:Uncharacterized protein n=2 Tax=Sphingomonas guangdongensis TaxID=1141890 RepID=A0A285R1E5_9SPHN|nr:hypothetical protein SAMN06297144_2681 [Sphingomonas guangdongensis]